ncbi:MAG: Acetyltransferase family protein [Bacteroidetes bacterium]|nr:Acetyltransferase family protein [Bacteroidota bacterium]
MNSQHTKSPEELPDRGAAATGSTPPASLLIRRAIPADGEALLRLIEKLAEYEHLTPPDEGARARLIRDMFSTPPRIEAYLALRSISRTSSSCRSTAGGELA